MGDFVGVSQQPQINGTINAVRPSPASSAYASNMSRIEARGSSPTAITRHSRFCGASEPGSVYSVRIGT